MSDVIFVGLTPLLLALTYGFTQMCEQLMEGELWTSRMRTFSIAYDAAKYFAIIPAAFASTYRVLTALNFMKLATPESAILSALIFNALIVIALIPLALRGVPYRPLGAARLLRDNLLIYGVGGLIAPFLGIKLIDMLLVVLHLV